MSNYLLLIILIIQFLLSSSLSAQNFSSFSIKNSPWHPSQNNILYSPNATFSAGFRPLKSSSNLYIFSVWYTNISVDNIVWSTNVTSPVSQTASLIITLKGELRLVNGSAQNGPNLWPSPAPVGLNTTQLTLTDEGNLVFGSWQSFLNPTDTILSGQTIGNDTVLRSNNGKFELTGSKNLVFGGSDMYWSSGSMFLKLTVDGRVLLDGAAPLLASDFGLTRTRKLNLGDDGNLRVQSFDPDKKKWVDVWVALLEICQVHGLCGPGYICYSDGSTLSNYECVCPPGFKRSSRSGSCERKTPMVDLGASKFLRLDYVNYSGGSNQTNLNSPSFLDCQSKCLSDSNCLGFGFKYDGTGYCVIEDKLLNGYWSPATEEAFYIRVDKSETDKTNFTGMSEVLTTTCPVRISLLDPPTESDETTRNIIIITTLFTIEVASGVLLFWAFLKKYVKYRDMARTLGLGLLPTAGPKRFTYAEIKAATKDFSNDNVIGKGGFSDVYIGKLHDGRPVAVKCLKNVTGGDTEFWAEVTIIARMHHLNLVRLWGFCNEKGRRILVYEHVPNGSLAKYLFSSGRYISDDQDSKDDLNSRGIQQVPVLDWNIRYRIALGVARAIAYLHEECLEWVLHCDIKPENILLGDDFCPKVADFGLSKLRKKEQLVTMSRIRGTRGYLAPEWTKNDSITSKVDVYSFGMVLLEIVSGVRNTVQLNSSMPSEEWYFPRWAFEMAIEEKRMDQILDRQIKHAYDNKTHFKMVDRMVKTAMWCLQERPDMRPSMGKVAKMLEGTVEIMEPPKPTIFFIEGRSLSV